MKPTILLLVYLISTYYTASAYSQGVTLNFKDTPISTVFSQIEKQTKYEFIYPATDLYNKRISISVSNAKIEEALEICLRGLPFTFYMNEKRIVVVKVSSNNDSKKDSGKSISVMPIELNGRVTNEKGEPVAGATVTVKGTEVSTATDPDGYFTIKSPDSRVQIVVSSVGYESKTIRLSGSSKISIQLVVTAQQMKEVVVSTGLELIPKERATGSYAFIDNKTLNEQVGTNILKRLEGVTSGLLFDNNKIRGGKSTVSNDNVSIRGISTIKASMDPLIVLDGFIYEGRIDNINPNDIDNVTVLKDAAASSIWGARAANGVIIINTKRGKLNQRASISVNITTIFKEKPDLYALPQIDPGDYVDVEQMLFTKGFFNSRINRKFIGLTPVVEVLQKRKLGLISSQDSARLLNQFRQTDSRNEYLEHLYTIPITQQFNLSLRGGGTANAYTFSFSYDDVKSDLRAKDKRFNIFFNNLFQPLKWLRADIGVYYTMNKILSGANPYGGIRPGGRISNYYKLYEDNGLPAPLATVFNGGYTDTMLNSKLQDWKFYPATDWKYSYSTTEIHDYYVTGGIQARIMPWLSFDVKGQYQRQTIVTDQINEEESYFTRDLINSFTSIDNVTGVLKSIVPQGTIIAKQTNTIGSFTGRTQLNIDKTWDEHQINGIIGYEIRDVKSIRGQYSLYGYKSDPRISVPVDFVHSYPHLIYKVDQSLNGYPIEAENVNRFVSTFGNFSYSYLNRYTISASARRDGSNLFGLRTNDKWKPLWSIGGMWKISSESFYNSKFVTNLSLRTTYGFSGNVDLSMTAIPIGIYSNSLQTNLPTARVLVLNNPDLKWEKSSMLNLGVDFSLANSVLSGSIDYYRRHGSDLYGRTLYDYTAWGNTDEITINSASMKGKGLDVVLNSRILNKEIKWNVSLLFNYNTNEVTKYSGANPLIYNKLNAGQANYPFVGQPLYSVSALRWGGLNEQGIAQGYVDGKLSTDYNAIFDEGRSKGLMGNLKYMGSTMPTYFGSVNNSVSFKGITFSCLVTYKFGYSFTKPILAYYDLVNNGAGTQDFKKRWMKPGDEKFTNVPVFFATPSMNTSTRDFFYRSSEVNILKGANIRLQYINLSYSFNEGRKNVPFKDAQVYLNASNLGIIWRANAEKLDPDYPSSIPPVRTFAIGVRANF